MLTHRGERPQDLMNHLVVACIDDQYSLLATAAALPAIDQKRRLRALAQQRGAFERELVTYVSELGGTPASHGSLGPPTRALFQRVKRALVGSTEGDAFRALAASEARTEALYAKVLRHALPPGARITIERQHGEVDRDQSAFRREQWAGPRHALAAPLPNPPSVAPAERMPRPARGPGHLARWDDDGGWQPGRRDDIAPPPWIGPRP